MPPEIAKLLWDTDDAAEKILRYSTGRTFEDFVKDDYFRSAVERQFATIGEAMTRLLRVDSVLAAQITDYRKIKSFRNIIVHGYDALDDATSWGVIENNLALLRRELASLMQGAE